MNLVKIFKGWPSGDAPSKLVQLWYRTFPPDQRGQVEMKKPTILSNKTSTARSCAEDQIRENENLRNKISNICAEGQVKHFSDIYFPVRESRAEKVGVMFSNFYEDCPFECSTGDWSRY